MHVIDLVSLTGQVHSRNGVVSVEDRIFSTDRFSVDLSNAVNQAPDVDPAPIAAPASRCFRSFGVQTDFPSTVLVDTATQTTVEAVGHIEISRYRGDDRVETYKDDAIWELMYFGHARDA